MRNDYNCQAKGLWRNLTLLKHIYISTRLSRMFKQRVRNRKGKFGNKCILNYHVPVQTIVPYKWKFSRVSNFAILWSKVVSLFSRVQFFANLKIHKISIPEIWLFKGVKAEDNVIPVYLYFRYRSIYLYTLVSRLINFLWKKILKHLNLFIYRIFKDVLAIFMTTILSIKLLFILWLESIKTELNVLNAVVIDKLITN